jgi:thymidylate kinase
MPDRTSHPYAAALEALSAAQIPYSFRKGWTPADAGAAPSEIDLEVPAAFAPAEEAALAAASFHRLRLPGRSGHRFYVRFDAGRWWKVDIRSDRSDAARPRVVRAASRARAAGPASWRRLGPVVAVLGPDGAGKGTVIAQLVDQIPIAVTVVYLGTRRKRQVTAAAPEAAAAPETAPQPAHPLREIAFLVRRFARMQFRLAGAYAAAWRGDVVLCDRHPVEILAVRPPRTPLGAAVERTLVGRLTPAPDAVIVLDAPASVLYERKPEHAIERLERWRAGYRSTFHPRGATFVETTGSRAETTASASAAVWKSLVRRRRWTT